MYDRGKKVFRVSIPCLSLKATINGINITTIGVLFKTELNNATQTKIKLINIVGGKFIFVSNKRTIEDTTPAATKPSAITNKDNTVISPGLEKPDNKSFKEGTLP